MNNIVPLNGNDDSSVESERITEAEFWRNINNENDDNAVLGFSLLRVVQHDRSITSLTVTNRCSGCIELAGSSYSETLTAAQAHYMKSLEFDCEDYAENATALGTHIASLPNLQTVIFDNARSCLEDTEYRLMFEEASESTSVKTLVFRRCRLNHHIGQASEVLDTILYTKAVETLIFENCMLDDTFMQAIDEAADTDSKWKLMKFEQCSFEDEVLHKIIVRNQADRMTETLIFHQCQSLGPNDQVLNVTTEY